MKVIAIIQARLNSSRFPMKVVASLGGKSILRHVLDRASRITGVDQVVLAIPQSDYPLLGHLWPEVVCGSEHDVLSRYAKAAERYEADICIRLTADCPLLAVDYASAALTHFSVLAHGHSDVSMQYMPCCQPYLQVCDGFDVEVFSCEALRYAQMHATTLDREHVTTFMRTSKTVAKTIFGWPDLNGPFKLSVDTKDDLQFVAQVYAKVGDDAGAYAILEAAREVMRVPQ